MTSKAAVDALVDRAVSEFGGLHVMANVAGIAHEGPIADVTEEETMPAAGAVPGRIDNLRGRAQFVQ